MHLIITAATAAALGLLLIALSIDAINRRMVLRVPFGDGGDRGLMAAIRAHANLTEYMPIGLAQIGLLESNGAQPLALSIVAALFVLVRLAHAYGLRGSHDKLTLGRSVGIIGTLLVLATMSGWLLALIARPYLGF